jgi:sodium/bile acid cotransporter 7
MASFWAVDSFAFTSTPTVPNNGISSPSPTGPRGKLKAVVGDKPRMFLAAGGDASLDQGLDGTVLKKLLAFADTNSFLVGLFFALFTAKIYPSLGVDGGLLHPELFVGKYGVGMIFLLLGLSLQTSALAKAVSNVRLNGLIQISTFVLWPFMVGLPLRTFLTSFMPNLIPSALADGLLILTCLPTTVNMCIMLTSSVSVSIVNHSRIVDDH